MCKNDVGPAKVDGTISDYVMIEIRLFIQIFFMKKIFVVLAAGIFTFAGCNDPDDTTETTDTASTTTSTVATDGSPGTTGVVTDDAGNNFLTKSANSGMAEVQLAKLAQQKATIDAVKSFAAMLERDHSAANEQVKTLANQRNVTLPAAPSDDKQKMHADMEKMSGKAFDKEYISMMVKSHNDGIDLFESTRSKTSDNDLKNFAEKTLPTLRMHLDSAKAIQKRYW